ncbi:amidohydrolase family protein [Robertkochia solimangrovi]|uniref:amidohydrolase family protein n=1 Tax=Robertkochia solimangrovi TaxID=2213046 RepID=UPI00117D573C|nr:amidohydrolase family protein [Robertkochia solimangrovi]TRZ45897.1 amidohydrolase [Robertkochia solimangrovi]
MKFRFFFLLLSTLFCTQLSAQEISRAIEKFVAIDTTMVAIAHVTLIDGSGEAIKNDQTIVFDKDRIISVGDSEMSAIPEGALIIDGTGKTVIPGLVMMHEHMFYSKPFENWFSVGQMTFSFPRLYLAGGVTTMRTAGSIQPQTDLNVKKWINEGKMTGPKMDVTGPFIERPGYEIPELGYIKGTEDVAEMVNYWAERGVTSFKLYNYITKEDMRICVEEAHKRGLKVTGHLCSITYEEASEIGIDNLEHGFMASSDFIEHKEENFCDPMEARKSLAMASVDDPRITRLIDILVKNGTAVTTTPVVFEPYTDYEVVPGGGEKALSPQILADVQARYDRRINKDSVVKASFVKDLIWLKRYYDKGGLLMAGTDPTGAGRTVAGYANQRTLEILVENGFPLVDAIKICTLNGAKYLGQEDSIGTIEPGKKSDLLLIDGDLQQNIRNIRSLQFVFKEGVGYDSAKLFESVKGMVGVN